MDKRTESNDKDPLPPEQVELNFFGIRFKCSGPTSKTIIILVVWLVFILVLVVLLPKITLMRWFSK